MTRTSMRAAVGGAGPDWQIQEIPVPVPGPGEALIAVRAAALNRADLLVLTGGYNPGVANLRTFTAGLEFAGDVVTVGEGVAGLANGSRVMGSTIGSFAEFAVVDHRLLMPVPDDLSWIDAAALPIGLMTEHDALRQTGFSPGDRVVIVGATSGVGMIGVQLAKAIGAGLVIATTTSDAKRSALRAAGADIVINTSTESLVDAVIDATRGTGADIVLDHVGGELFAQLLPATKTQGTIINIGRLAGAIARIDLDQLAFRRLRLLGTTFSIRTADERAEVVDALRAQVIPWLASEKLRPTIDSVYQFGELHQAADRMRSNQATGKIVLEMPQPG